MEVAARHPALAHCKSAWEFGGIAMSAASPLAASPQVCRSSRLTQPRRSRGDRRRCPWLLQARRLREIDAAVCSSPKPATIHGRSTPPSAALPSPPGVHVASPPAATVSIPSSCGSSPHVTARSAVFMSCCHVLSCHVLSCPWRLVWGRWLL